MHEHTVGSAGRLTHPLPRRPRATRRRGAGRARRRRRRGAVRLGRGGGGRAGGVGRGRRRAVPAGARPPSRGAGTDAADARRPSRRAARDRRPLAAHHRRLLRGDLRPGERREARHHGRTTSPPSRVWSTPCPRWISAGRPSAPRTGRPRCAGLHELYLALANTGKHVQTVTVVEPDLAEAAVAMAAAVAGSAEALRAAPPVSALLGTVTPLGNDAGTLEAGLVFAAAGVPVGLRDHAHGRVHHADHDGRLARRGHRRGAGGRVRRAGRVPAARRCSSASSRASWTSRPGTSRAAPRRTPSWAPRSRTSARFYGLPTQCGINSSGAKEPGWQSALDDTTTTFLSLAAGVDMLTGVGMVSGGRIFSYEEMALAADTVSQARAVARGIDLSGLDGPADRPGRPPATPAAPS